MSILQDVSQEDALLALFCSVDDSVDDFCQAFLSLSECRALPQAGKASRRRTSSLSESEIITLLTFFHQSRYRDFKTFYLAYVCSHWQAEFPRLVS